MSWMNIGDINTWKYQFVEGQKNIGQGIGKLQLLGWNQTPTMLLDSDKAYEYAGGLLLLTWVYSTLGSSRKGLYVCSLFPGSPSFSFVLFFLRKVGFPSFWAFLDYLGLELMPLTSYLLMIALAVVYLISNALDV